jgi:hypothetical protein
MKRFGFLLNSLAGKIILFLLTFAVGAAASRMMLIQNSSSIVSPVQTSQVFESPSVNAQKETEEFLTLEAPNSDAPNVVQSLIVDFPVSGRVIVQAVEQVGEFPQMRFISAKTGRILLRRSIKDEDKSLIPEKDGLTAQSQLRFRTIDSKGFGSPLIMSVAVAHGGSDSSYYLTVFGEVGGKIQPLNDKPFGANIQGGFYLGYLNKNLGYGLAVWDFIWGNGIDESHYAKHKYSMEIYQIRDGKLKRVVRKISRKMYDSNENFRALQELGIKAVDQRTKIPEIKDEFE